MVDISVAQHAGGLVRHLFGEGQQAFARRCQRHAVGPSVEKALTDLLFQPIDPAQYRRPVDFKRFGGPVQGAELTDCEKYTKVIPIQHVLHYCTSSCEYAMFCCN